MSGCPLADRYTGHRVQMQMETDFLFSYAEIHVQWFSCGTEHTCLMLRMGTCLWLRNERHGKNFRELKKKCLTEKLTKIPLQNNCVD